MRIVKGIICLSMTILGGWFCGCVTEVSGGGPDISEGSFRQDDACTQGSFASATCEDPSEWKDQANGICEAAGLELTAFDYDIDKVSCNWKTFGAKYQCCPAAPPPVNPAPPPTTATCTKGSVGDSSTCTVQTDIVDFKAMAIDQCMQVGLSLSDYTIDVGNCPPGEVAAVYYSCTSGGYCPP